MESIFLVAAIYLFISVLAAIVAYRLRISIALIEICLGVAAAAIANHFFGQGALGSDTDWLKFLASAGAILLTFLAGAELEPSVMKTKLKEVSVVGLIATIVPFAAGFLVACFALSWSIEASLLAGIALSSNSIAVIYAVLLETGLNRTEFGKGILGSSFVNNLIAIIALGLVFSPFTYKTLIFVGASVLVIASLPRVTRHLTRVYGNRTAAIRTKWVLAILVGLGFLAYWSGSEPVLPAYVAGIALAEFVSTEHEWLRRLRTLTTGFLTPFFFIRAGTFVSIPALIAAPIAFLFLFLAKVLFKPFFLYPAIAKFRKDKNERWYYSLLMSTGLTFGMISAVFGLSHGIVSQDQYSLVIGAIIMSAIVPTLIAMRAFFPKHLLPNRDPKDIAVRVPEGSPAEE